jgi:lysophospholipase L1-like esterase
MAALAAIVIGCAGCTPFLFVIGDSQTTVSTPTLQTTLQPIDGDNLVQGHNGCGLYVDYACDPSYDLHADVEHRLAAGTPKWVVVEFGTNDALFHSYDELAATYESKIEEFVSWWPESVQIFWVNLAYMPCCRGGDASVDVINAAIDDVAATDPRVTVIDLHTAFLDHLTDWFGGDGLHFNANGQAAYADLVCQDVGDWSDSPNVGACPALPSTTTTSVPDTTTSVPDDTTTSVPDTTTSIPDDTTTSVPDDTTTSAPDTTTSEPDDTTTSVPDTTSSTTDTSPGG